ncbi:hypothetical protein [Longimicrobium sp.]|uniref:hypothetical protein n=1 Tax=Longimicrobium sp. TaxID=2029185 RepID=UPI002F92F59F
MSLGEEIRLQEQILEQMESARRLAYRGPLVLNMSVDTSVRNPPQAHSIAKNLLDLFSKPRPELQVNRNLIYADDVQVHGLAVWCRHGQPEPRIDSVSRHWRASVLTSQSPRRQESSGESKRVRIRTCWKKH